MVYIIVSYWSEGKGTCFGAPTHQSKSPTNHSLNQAAYLQVVDLQLLEYIHVDSTTILQLQCICQIMTSCQGILPSLMHPSDLIYARSLWHHQRIFGQDGHLGTDGCPYGHTWFISSSRMVVVEGHDGCLSLYTWYSYVKLMHHMTCKHAKQTSVAILCTSFYNNWELLGWYYVGCGIIGRSPYTCGRYYRKISDK